jgi:hypothetical protein
MIDKLIVTDVDDYRPKTADDRDPAPAAVAGLRVTKTTANSVELAWNATPDADPYCYSVYVGEKPDFACGNETLLSSGKKTAALDWGIPAGKSFHYKVIAIDQCGHESPPASLEARTEALETKTVTVSATDARASAGLVKGDGFIEYPGKAAGEQSLAFDVDVPADGTYHVWMKYTPTFNQEYAYDCFGVELDEGRMVVEGARPRPPRNQGAKPGRWFCQRILGGQKLSAGRHTLTLRFADDKDLRTRMGQRIAGVWITNDASFVPPDYTAQVMFKDPEPWTR